MSNRKQELLRRHRRNKRLVLSLAVLVMAAFLDNSVVNIGPWWVAPLLALAFWLIHEAWFADHLFYSPTESYEYAFPPGTPSLPIEIVAGVPRSATGTALPAGSETLILKVRVRSTWLGCLFDPRIHIDRPGLADRQDFERRCSGWRYLNLSGCEAALNAGTIRLRGRFLRMAPEAELYCFSNPDYAQRRAMIIAPHADDAELAAFGFYSRCREVSIVTLTQGEIEARYYRRLGLDKEGAARLKGRLRAWNSLAVPLWGGVHGHDCLQLGYYCLRLAQMRASPDQAFGSLESGERDIRNVRRLNERPLPGDRDGASSWKNLIADLVCLLEHYRPEVLLVPHPELDPHADHVHATIAVDEAIGCSNWKPAVQLLYANHLYDNDRWPMGPADHGVALPPVFGTLPSHALWSPQLSPETCLDKAMALAMQHDLQVPLSLKKRIRRHIQRILIGRRWPTTGNDEFFRKAVRRHELFWVRKL
ncbi:PIG-L deacetylase family protein [Stutzerimonas stutzeri]|uniref:PIG-L deacetylase family protein n=1 Tax=Stutzerimonas stutzeri TaxID=316 RepID=UPI00300F4CAC